MSGFWSYNSLRNRIYMSKSFFNYVLASELQNKSGNFFVIISKGERKKTKKSKLIVKLILIRNIFLRTQTKVFFFSVYIQKVIHRKTHLLAMLLICYRTICDNLMKVLLTSVTYGAVFYRHYLYWLQPRIQLEYIPQLFL